MTRCRACAGERLRMFLPLGSHPPANGFLSPDQLSAAEPSFPLEAHVCLDCGLIQIADNVPADFFRHYVYVPSASEEMATHFRSFASTVADELIAGGGGLVVDIGCNDGLFLASLHERGVRTLGIDPATNIVERARARGIDVVNEYFTPDLARSVRAEYGPAAVIVTTNTYHHIGDLDAFTEGVAILLDDAGTFIIEVPHAMEIVATNQFDGIYHEHVSQFTVKSVADHVRRFGLELDRVDPLTVHGGSLRLYVRRAASPNGLRPGPRAWVEREAERGLFDEPTYEAFRDRVESIRGSLMDLLRGLKAEGNRIAAYGASARGNTLLNYYGIGPELIDYVADRNTLKHGLFTPGMHVPVTPDEHLLTDRPDYVLLLAWNFAEEILRQQEAYRNAGGRFIVPIPEPRVIV